jgi:hypothetical protein
MLLGHHAEGTSAKLAAGVQQCFPYVLRNIACVQEQEAGKARAVTAQDGGAHVRQARLAGSAISHGACAHIQRGQLLQHFP